ncbi:uncharacterized protein LOC130116313 [Lampris incognitus]|uniref:uncharacterized protein LOC130116313 n=1 Tax=Lampris incognitus TaxID=2546036 RepID=UPI0024B530E6|nr:uncharacterized protein LOC130116313 [Lampris incognitus]
MGYVTPYSALPIPHKCDALQYNTRVPSKCSTETQATLAETSCKYDSHTRASSCYTSKPSAESSIMVQGLFIYGVLAVLLAPVWCELISVCVEDDEDLRVDCHIEPKPSQINSYEFSWSSGAKETLINSNISGSVPNPQFKDRSYVQELEPHGYRMTLTDFTHKLPYNMTFMCKMSRKVASVTLERDHLLPCSAVSVFLRSPYSWIANVLLFLLHTNGWDIALH